MSPPVSAGPMAFGSTFTESERSQLKYRSSQEPKPTPKSVLKATRSAASSPERYFVPLAARPWAS